MDSQRCYIRRSLVPFEEDEYNEFKGHRSISIEELPPWCFQKGTNRRSRKAASSYDVIKVIRKKYNIWIPRERLCKKRAIAAFFNSGRGGTVYLGIVDEGAVKGLYLTEFQKDHVVVSIKDLFSRYTPPVADDKYEIIFVPVFGQDDVERKVKADEELDKSTAEKHLRSHLMRTYDFCWCDKELAASIDKDEKVQDYIIEVKVFPQKGSFIFYEDTYKAVLPIVYSNEEGKCFFRKSASCVEYTLDAVRELAKQQITDLYQPILTNLRQELDHVMRELGIT